MNLEARVQELATLNEIGDILNREPDFSKALEPALSRLVDLVELTTGWVFMTNVEEGDLHQGSFHLAAHTGLPPALSKNNLSPLCDGSCECQGMFQRGELDHGVNMVTCSRLKWSDPDRNGLEIHASIPLLGQQGPVGIINLTAPGDTTFDAERLEFLTAIGRQLGTAYDRSKLQAERTREAQYLAVLEERHRLAQDMHDSVAQLLFAADLSVRVAQDSTDASLQESSLSKTSDLIQDALSELQSLVEVMRSPDLSSNLKDALARLAKRTTGSIKVHLEAERLELSPKIEDALYRIAQEAVHNALRHAQASNIWMILKNNDQRIILKIKDDGLGLDAQASTLGLGLESMRERAESLDGQFTIYGEAHKGCTILVEIPYAT